LIFGEGKPSTMSYTVLARKWRPKRFAEVVGQQHVVQTLVNSLAAGRLHHAYLFAGTRGVGKTTVARILAKALNCVEGVVAEPCGVCDACVAIDEGRFIDLLEVDAASRTRVDDTRELLDNVQYSPTHGRYKVYLIDEVHMLSNHSFNALLKTLEEPPPHVKFLLATTDPQKLPVTVLSRCLQFNLKRLTIAQIQEQLAKICSAEGVDAEPDGLRALARGAEGSMRDALSLLDQAIAFGGGQVAREPVESMLGTIDRSHLIKLLQGLAASDGSALINEVAELDEQAPDYSSVLDGLMGALQRLAVIQLVDESPADHDDEALPALAEAISPEDVQLYYQIALQGRRDLATSADWRSAFEMTLLRMLAFRPAGAEREKHPAGAASEPRRSPTHARARPRDAERAMPPPAGPETGTTAADSPAPQVSAAVAVPTETPGTAEWLELLSAADVRGAARQLAEHCVVQRLASGRIDLILAEEKAHLNTAQVRARLEGLLAEHLGAPLKLSIAPGRPPEPTPAEQRQANETQRMRKAREAIEQDPTVRGFQAAFDAVVEADSIQPVEAVEGSSQR
jgi:DNA polymerase-3 subunit gamma/tau